MGKQNPQEGESLNFPEMKCSFQENGDLNI